MAIYEITSDGFVEIKATDFATEEFYERQDMQRYLRQNIAVILPNVLVIAEEFGDWDESKRRIDLLGLGRDGSLVVIELKRNTDGAHMELQAIRYAGMISKMTFEEAIAIYHRFLGSTGDIAATETRLRDHISVPGTIEEHFGKDIRIVLVSADFGKELTTAVMWLREFEMDIRCIRMIPYRDGDRVLVNVQPIIPLPEAEEYQIRIRQKQQSQRQERGSAAALRRFWDELLPISNARTGMTFQMSTADKSYLRASTGVRGVHYAYVANRKDFRVDLYISRDDADTSKQIFQQLLTNRVQIEEAFGGVLSWQELPEKTASRIAALIDFDGDRDEESNWPEVHEALVSTMARFKLALAPFLTQIQI